MSSFLKQVRGAMADPKKLGVLLTLLALSLLLWGRLLLKDAPRTATADPAAKIEAALAAHAGGTAGEISDANKEKTVPVVLMDVAGDLPRAMLSASGDGADGTGEKSYGPVTKSVPELSDEELRSAAVRETAAGLELQSVISGDQPRAVINGRTLKPGETFEGFTLIEVASSHVVLEHEGVIVRLGM